jgi:DNA-binding CsgD family transcriptional regulator
MLLGRAAERDALDRLLGSVRAGLGGALVVRGEAGIGKTALLDYAVTSAPDMLVRRVVGVQSEMELGYAGLHTLLRPFAGEIESLPLPQREAVRAAFGLDVAEVNRMLVGVATLTVLSIAGSIRPVLCVIDDAQWLDRESAEAIAFVARRLEADAVGVLIAIRTAEVDGAEFGRLPEMRLQGLDPGDGAALLAGVVGPLQPGVAERVVADTEGNPLALIELGAALSATELVVQASAPMPLPVGRRLEQRFAAQVGRLPAETRALLLVAAADTSGDLWRVVDAGRLLGVDIAAADAAVAADVLVLEPRLAFRHPLIRSAVYYGASDGERRRAHAALAEATDAELDPDRRAWHRALAAPGPDEDVAAELERSAARARALGRLAAAEAFLGRSVKLTPDPARRSVRALTAAEVSLAAGAFDAASEMLAAAEAGTLDELGGARVELLRGQIAFASSVGGDAALRLLTAARRLGPLDLGLARETYLDAWGAALFAGGLAGEGGLLEVSRAARSAPPPSHPPRAPDLLLEGLALLVTDGRAAAAPALRLAASAFATQDTPTEEDFRWGWLATLPSNVLWDDATLHAINVRQLRAAREAGALARLPIDLSAYAVVATFWGDFAQAAAAIAEANAITDATGTLIAPYGALLLAAFRGHEAEALRLIDSTINDATAGGQGIGVQYARWVEAVLFNGLGRHERALAAAVRASEEAPELFLSAWALPELIEAAQRTGETDLGAGALERLAEATAAAGTDWALGVAARSRALLSEGDSAESLFGEAIERLSRTRLRPELARTHLLYGEWLRRVGRRADAREHLGVARTSFEAIGADAFAQRARAGPTAAHERASKSRAAPSFELTPQEAQVAHLAAEGATNAEIGARLFISPNTVDYHLRKVYPKLGVSSRTQLQRALTPP